jgi:hypothetical protein
MRYGVMLQSLTSNIATEWAAMLPHPLFLDSSSVESVNLRFLLRRAQESSEAGERSMANICSVSVGNSVNAPPPKM